MRIQTLHVVSCLRGVFRRTLPAFSIGDAPPYYLSAGDTGASGNDEDEDLVVV